MNQSSDRKCPSTEPYKGQRKTVSIYTNLYAAVFLVKIVLKTHP